MYPSGYIGINFFFLGLLASHSFLFLFSMAVYVCVFNVKTKATCVYDRKLANESHDAKGMYMERSRFASIV